MDSLALGTIKPFSIVGMALAFTFFSCVDPIPFEIYAGEPQLVIFGTLTQLNQDHNMTVAYASRFGGFGELVNDAEVWVVDQGGRRGNYAWTTPGTYTLREGSYPMLVGDIYHLEVTLSTGLKYISAAQQLPAPISIDDVEIQVNTKLLSSDAGNLVQGEFIDILVNTDLSDAEGSRGYFRWEVEQTFSFVDWSCGGLDNADQCYFQIDEKFSELLIFNSINSSQGRLESFPVFSRRPAPYVEFLYRHYFNVYQYVISPSAYDYWERINVVTAPSGSIFDKVPAGVKGNIHEVGKPESAILGYFEIAGASVYREFTTPFSLQEQLFTPNECSELYPYWFSPDYCCYCWMLPYETISRPDYW